MSKTRVEIWMGGMMEPTYIIRDPQRVDMSIDCTTVKIVTDRGRVIETSPHNIVMISEPEENR